MAQPTSAIMKMFKVKSPTYCSFQPMSEAIAQIHVWIEGQVQGVGYRASTRYQANQRHIKGWVRNLPTGEVEAVFVGSQEALDSMLQWCRSGPPAAQVTNVRVQTERLGPYSDFQITL